MKPTSQPKNLRNLIKLPAKLPRAVIAYVAIGSLVPDAGNPRKHSAEQIAALARSMRAFGFNAPILVDKFDRIVQGTAASKRRSCSG